MFSQCRGWKGQGVVRERKASEAESGNQVAIAGWQWAMGGRKHGEGRLQGGMIRQVDGRYNGRLLCAISNTF